MTVEETTDGVFLRAAPDFPLTEPDAVFASLAFSGLPKSIEEMDAGIIAEARRRHAGA